MQQPPWSAQGTQWPQRHTEFKETRELLNEDERNALKNAVKHADQSSNDAMTKTQHLQLRLQHLEDAGFLPQGPRYRDAERPHAETAILARGDRLSRAQLRNESEKFLEVWSADDAAHWRVTHAYSTGRARSLRTKLSGLKQELAETRRLEVKDDDVSHSTRRSRGSRDSRASRDSSRRTKETETSFGTGPRIASAAELGVERPPELRALRPAFYRRTLRGDLELTEDGADEVDERAPSGPASFCLRVSALCTQLTRRCA